MSHSGRSSNSTARSIKFSGTKNITSDSLKEFSDRELVSAVEKLRQSNKRVDMENDICESFLKKMDPKLLTGMNRMLTMVNIVESSTVPKLTSQISIVPQGVVKSESLSSVASQMSGMSFRKSSVAGSWFSAAMAGPRINLQTKIDLAKREKERTENQITNFIAKSKIRRMNLRAQLQELALQLAEIKEARDIFEQTICRDGKDPITGRIPAEKFIRYMEEWLKSADSIIEKLRLRRCTLQYKYNNLHKQLAQKEELGERIHPVDFDVLKIQNKILTGTIDAKNIDLLKLKQKVGEVNLLLAKSQRYLQKQLKDKSMVQQQIDDYKATKNKIDKETEQVKIEVENTEKKLDNMKNLVENYTVPEVIDYIRLKKELDDLRKEIKIWTRRNNLQKVALSTSMKTMKRLESGKKSLR